MKQLDAHHGGALFMRGLLLSSLLMLAIAPRMMAQDDPYVIKSGNYYLAHVNTGTAQSPTWVIQGTTTFSAACIWYSGNTYSPTGWQHNYYFDDGTKLRYLSAPLTANSTVTISDDVPSSIQLKNTLGSYYFYNWDQGLARGEQNTLASSAGDCQDGYSWSVEDNQCWKVLWLVCDGGTWKTYTESKYAADEVDDAVGHAYAARFYQVTVTEHDRNIISTLEGGVDCSGLTAQVLNHNGTYSPSITAADFRFQYTPAYTKYAFNGETHILYDATDDGVDNPTDQGSTLPSPISTVNPSPATSYAWTLSDGADGYLTITNETTNNPTITYSTLNTNGTQTFTLTLTVTYDNTATQECSTTITVNTPCMNPTQSASPNITYEGVTVSWYPTAESYKIYWSTDQSSWTSETVGDVSSYTITGLADNTEYYYKVVAICGGDEQPSPTVYSFTTKPTPGLLVYGAVFGGGRMANVTGNTEVVIINCDSLGAVYGGNDIAGAVEGDAGSAITLGVTTGAYATYGTTNAAIKIGSVYGGGNGYYAYDGSSFVAASSSYSDQDVADEASVKAMTLDHQVGDAVWTNHTGAVKNLTFPTIVKTNITVTNDYVKVDSIFGGAKNAFLTTNSGNGSTITVNGGTVYALFGGNNFGGGQGNGKHHIDINNTKAMSPLATNTINGTWTGYGRDFGIRYLFGGGNKVYGSTAEVAVYGGMVDTLFGGGNRADVDQTSITVDCSISTSGSGLSWGSTYSDAISSYATDNITVKDNYAWNGTGIYNVRTLFGGNNAANMSKVPTITLTSGSLGTVYGGGNAGDMLAEVSGTIDGSAVNYGTHVTMDSPNVMVDYLYGGCQKSNVRTSTWVEVKKGHVGTVYGGCNISGDVGSTRVNMGGGTRTVEYQTVEGGTYVVLTGGVVYNNVFAGSNGFYHCNTDYIYSGTINYDPRGRYIGTPIPTHNQTTVVVSKDDGAGTAARVKGNVYAGGNLAPVGFPESWSRNPSYPQVVGLATVHMNGGQVDNDVYGGGNMASVYGSSEVEVSGGTILGSLYGGNDRIGSVALMTNRVLNRTTASNGASLENVHTYVYIYGNPLIGTVYGGGNGAYTYTAADGIEYCDAGDKPYQSMTFVDVHIDGGGSDAGGYIGTVYGGGDGVTIRDGATVLLNTVNAIASYDNVGTIFGGNNIGDLDVVPEIILLKGQANTVYGGCNKGAMTGSKTIEWGPDNNSDNHLDSTFANVGSYVRLLNNNTAKVSGYVYGGCRMNGVDNNSLVLVEGGTHTCSIFGGSDISGDVAGTSRVIIDGTSASIGSAYGGGNGNYTYTGDLAGLVAPYCNQSRVDMYHGTCTGNLYAGGYAGECGDTYLRVENGTVEGKIFGGGNEAGTTTANGGTGTSTIRMIGGTVESGVYGGCNTIGNIAGAVTVNVDGGTVGTSISRAEGIFGGGYGQPTTTSNNVTVNVGLAAAANQSATPTVYADIYGGSALGSVNTNTSNTTTVNVLNGTIAGNVYGGGLGAATLDGNGFISSVTTQAVVNGNVQVNIGANDGSNYLTFNHGTNDQYGNIFGCNNLAGSPLGTVHVDVYKTAHTDDDAYSATLRTGIGQQTAFAISSVYGGGNLAPYTPTTTPLVHIHNCDNTIRYVYGGGNAASVPQTDVTIDGGRFEYIFAGGNGEGTGNPGANVGYTSYTSSSSNETYIDPSTGNAHVLMNGGIVDHLFGGSNTKGAIRGTTNLEIPDLDDGVCARIINELYGGGNEAPSDGDIVITLPCVQNGNVEVIKVFCGANNADINGNITLNVQGGSYEQVFAGNNNGGTITGDVTLNLYGGTIGSAFGGCNAGGVIQGDIIVNVDSNQAYCPLTVDYVYGGGNEAAYTPTKANAKPTVNILRGSVQHDVFGGGYGTSATVTANPVVIVGGRTTNPDDTPIVFGNVYGGGSKAQVNGNTQVKILNKAYIVNNVYGGGNEAAVTGCTDVQIGD